MVGSQGFSSKILDFLAYLLLNFLLSIQIWLDSAASLNGNAGASPIDRISGINAKMVNLDTEDNKKL